MRSPLVSLVLAVKNGLPHLKTAIEAIARQTYTPWELVVQDGASTDGTVEYLSAAGIPNMRLESAPDDGVGDAFNRALARSSGELICFVSADEYLEDDAIERGVASFAVHPDAVFINGSVRLINAADELVQVFESPHFDLVSHLKCETVLSFAGLLDRTRLGADCFLDASLKTCPDYDFWIRLGSRFEPSRFIVVDDIFKTARADRISMSFRAESFEQFCADKTLVLDRFLDSQPAGSVIRALRPLARAGIFLWAAESVFALEGASPDFIRWCRKAAETDPWSPRLQSLAARSDAFTVDGRTGSFSVTEARQPDEPTCATTRVPRGLDLRETFSLPHWAGARVEHDGPVVVQTGRESWAYAAEIPVPMALAVDGRHWYWARVDLEVVAGQVNVGLLVNGALRDERLIVASQGRSTVFLKVTRGGVGVIIRNGGLSYPSTVRLFDAAIEKCEK